jgi:hypothetical protein
VRVRFAPSPTGSLHVGNALSAVINRGEGDWLLLRIDDTDPARNVPQGEEAILEDLGWIGLEWDEGPVRQSERQEAYRAAAERLGELRFDGITLVREDGTATYHLASVVDDVDFGITHVFRGNDHRSNEQLHRRLHEALGTTPPHYVHHGLILGEDGKKLSKRAAGATVASLRELGLPAEAVRAYLDELGLPRHARSPGGGRIADAIITPPAGAATSSPETLERFRELRERADGLLDAAAAKAIVRELKAVGGDLRALRLALTGAPRGPELWTVVLALPRDEALRRIDAAIQ